MEYGCLYVSTILLYEEKSVRKSKLLSDKYKITQGGYSLACW